MQQFLTHSILHFFRDSYLQCFEHTPITPSGLPQDPFQNYHPYLLDALLATLDLLVAHCYAPVGRCRWPNGGTSVGDLQVGKKAKGKKGG